MPVNFNKIPFEDMKNFFHCDLEVGNLYWSVNHGNAKAGSKAGTIRNGKSRFISFNGIDYPAARVVWAFANNGEDPDFFIKFKDGNSLNCAIDNLFLAERSEFDTRTLEGRRANDLKNKDHIRAKRLASVRLKKYGITVEQYNKMLVEQKGVCAICEEPETVVIAGVLTSLSVDHCHDTGKVRGLLCSSCNRALGAFGDNEELLLSAVRYVRKSKGTNVVPLIKCEEA